MKVNKNVKGVAVKGRYADYSQWVTTFKVSYSTDGTNFTAVDNDKVYSY